MDLLFPHSMAGFLGESFLAKSSLENVFYYQRAPKGLVACSAIGVSVAATPPCSAIRFCKEISLRHSDRGWQDRRNRVFVVRVGGV